MLVRGFKERLRARGRGSVEVSWLTCWLSRPLWTSDCSGHQHHSGHVLGDISGGDGVGRDRAQPPRPPGLTGDFLEEMVLGQELVRQAGEEGIPVTGDHWLE